MKKILLPLSLISVLSLAQQNTGINTTNPQATLEVASKTENTTNEVEGLLIPRVSKQKALLMAQNQASDQPKESTLIYINDLTDFVDPADGTETTVAAITENGYYHWNDSQWVKVVGKEGEIWKKNINGQVVLHQPTRLDSVIYKSQVGYQIKPKVFPDYQSYRLEANGNDPAGVFTITSEEQQEELNVWNTDFIRKYFFGSTLNIEHPIDRELSSFGIVGEKKLFFLDSGTPEIKGAHGNVNYSIIPADNANDYNYFYANSSGATHVGTGNVFRILGTYNYANLSNPNSKASYIQGSYNQATSYSSNPVSYMDGSFNYFTPGGSGEIVFGNANRNRAYIRPSFTSNIKNLTLSRNELEIRGEDELPAGGSIENLYGARYDFNVVETSPVNISNQKGIFVNDVNLGTTSNYSIYTNAGDIRFGDLVGTGERIVTADADGVLTTSSESLANLSSKWKNDVDNNIVKLNNLADGTTERTPDNSFVVDNNGNVGIGTISPTYKLDVEGVGEFNDIRNLGWMYNYNSRPTHLMFSDSDKNSSLLFNMQWDARGDYVWKSNDSQPTYAGRISYIAKSNKFYFQLTPSIGNNGDLIGGDKNNILVLDGVVGNVRIGSVKPYPLANNRSLIVEQGDGSIGLYSNKLIKTNDVISKIDLGARQGSLYQTAASIKTISVDDVYVGGGVANRFGADLVFSTAPVQGNLANDESKPIERLRISSVGNVGIGTLTPTEKLDVAGDVRAENFISTVGTSVQFPDYVFQNYYNGASNLNADYDFKSLEEVETYIKENGHLPGYFSAEEVEKAGQFDMTATQLTNVEKIEELYLHLLEKEKEVKALKAALEVQKAENEAQNVRLEKLEQLLMK